MIINMSPININNILFKIAIFSKIRAFNETGNIVLPFFANLFNVWLAGGQLESHSCFCVHLVVLCSSGFSI